MASTYLTQSTSSSTGKIFTLSMWFKKCSNVDEQLLLLSSDSNTYWYIDISTKIAGGLDIQLKDGNGGTYLRRKTNRLFRDTSGWYNAVIRFDSTEGTASDRLRIYINGTQETAIDADSTPDVPLNFVTDFSNAGTLRIGRSFSVPSPNYFDGLMSYVILCDGYSYGPDSFGETDATSGEWKIKTSLSVTYGTNGFFILKDGNGITDQSGEGNDFTLGGGTLTDLKDCPDDILCTINPLETYFIGSSTITNCSTTYNSVTAGGGSTNYTYPASTLGMNKGKYYAECKVTSRTGGMGNQTLIGIYGRYSTSTQYYVAEYASTYRYY